MKFRKSDFFCRLVWEYDTTPIAAVAIVKFSNSTINDTPGSTDMSILPA